MNNSIINISIPTPCNEDWHNMLPDARGKYCNSCKKTVTDFTLLSNTEILNLLSGKDKVCGRFDEIQLLSLNNEIAPQYRSFLSSRKFSFAAAFIGFIPFIRVEAKVTRSPYLNLVPFKTSLPGDTVKKPVAKSIDKLSKTGCNSKLDSIPTKKNVRDTVPQIEIVDISTPLNVIAGGVCIRRSLAWRVWYAIKKPFARIFN